jgi:hypothetical protein
MRTSGRRERTAIEKLHSLKGTDGGRIWTTSLPQNCVLCRLSDSEFDDSFGWNLNLLLRLGIEAGTSFPFLLYQLAKTGQDKFTVVFVRLQTAQENIRGIARRTVLSDSALSVV